MITLLNKKIMAKRDQRYALTLMDFLGTIHHSPLVNNQIFQALVQSLNTDSSNTTAPSAGATIRADIDAVLKPSDPMITPSLPADFKPVTLQSVTNFFPQGGFHFPESFCADLVEIVLHLRGNNTGLETLVLDLFTIKKPSQPSSSDQAYEKKAIIDMLRQLKMNLATIAGKRSDPESVTVTTFDFLAPLPPSYSRYPLPKGDLTYYKQQLRNPIFLRSSDNSTEFKLVTIEKLRLMFQEKLKCLEDIEIYTSNGVSLEKNDAIKNYCIQIWEQEQPLTLEDIEKETLALAFRYRDTSLLREVLGDNLPAWLDVKPPEKTPAKGAPKHPADLGRDTPGPGSQTSETKDRPRSESPATTTPNQEKDISIDQKLIIQKIEKILETGNKDKLLTCISEDILLLHDPDTNAVTETSLGYEIKLSLKLLKINEKAHSDFYVTLFSLQAKYPDSAVLKEPTVKQYLR